MPNLRRFNYFVFVFLYMSLVSHASAWGEKENMNLESQEIFVQFYPVDKILMIREYGLSSLLTDKNEIQRQAEEIQNLIINAEYCKKRFGLERYIVGQEKLLGSYNGEIYGANTECILITADEMPNSMITAFSNALKRDVEVTGNPAEITLSFDAPDIGFDVSNTLRIVGYHDSDKVELIWKNGERTYEVLFVNKTRSLDLFKKQSIFEFFPEFPVMSPHLNPDDIEKLRESLM